MNPRRQERRWLVEFIREVLIPGFLARGFALIALTEGERRSDVGAVCPFGRLRRVRGECWDVLDIQLADYGAPAFTITAGVVSTRGIVHPFFGPVPAEDLWAAQLPIFFEFYALPAIRRWFSLWHWPGRRIARADVQILVEKVAIEVIPEIDVALIQGHAGKHVKVVHAYTQGTELKS